MTKKSQATKKTANQAVSVSRIKLNRLILDSWLIVQGFFGIFVLLALISYSVKDPGWTSQTFTSGLVDNTKEISNFVGSWGAYLSDFLLTVFGYMSYILPYWLLWPLISHFFIAKNSIPFSDAYSGLLGLKVFGWLLVVVSGSTLFSIILEPGFSYLPQEGGGLIGSKISSLTLGPLSTVGSGLLFISLVLLGLTLSLEVSWANLISKSQTYLLTSGTQIGEKLSNFLENLRQKQKLKKEKIERKEKVIENNYPKATSKTIITINPPINPRVAISVFLSS